VEPYIYPRDKRGFFAKLTSLTFQDEVLERKYLRYTKKISGYALTSFNIIQLGMAVTSLWIYITLLYFSELTILYVITIEAVGGIAISGVQIVVSLILLVLTCGKR